jgi:predicted GIY-YIG superfamily endonuclease
MSHNRAPTYLRCYRCHQHGHFANECLLPPAPSYGLPSIAAAFLSKPTRASPYVVGKCERKSKGGQFMIQPPSAAAGGQHVVGRVKAKDGPSVHVIGKTAPAAATKALKGARSEAGVYALELAGGKYYVGKSGNVLERIEQHRAGAGASCAEGFRRRVPTLTPPDDDAEAWERAETLARMRRHGISRVRGWMFTAPELTEAQREAAFAQVCERFDLCRRCGRAGHFAAACHCGAGSRAWFFSA